MARSKGRGGSRRRVITPSLSRGESSCPSVAPKRRAKKWAHRASTRGYRAIKEILMSITPYLLFDSRWEEAIAFYREALGAEIAVRRT